MEWDPKQQVAQGQYPPGFGPGRGDQQNVGSGSQSKWDLPPAPPPLPTMLSPVRGLWPDAHRTSVAAAEESLKGRSMGGLSPVNQGHLPGAMQGQPFQRNDEGHPAWKLVGGVPQEFETGLQSRADASGKILGQWLGNHALHSTQEGTLPSQSLLDSARKATSESNLKMRRPAIQAQGYTSEVGPGKHTAQGTSIVKIEQSRVVSDLDQLKIGDPVKSATSEEDIHSVARRPNLLSAWRAGQNITDHRDVADERMPLMEPGGFHAEEDPKLQCRGGSKAANQDKCGLDTAFKLPYSGAGPIGPQTPFQKDINHRTAKHSVLGVDMPSSSRTACFSSPEESSFSGGTKQEKTKAQTLGGRDPKVFRAWWERPQAGFVGDSGSVAPTKSSTQKPAPWIPPQYPGMPRLDILRMSKEELLEILPCQRIIFGGVFLLKQSRDLLLSHLPPKHFNVYCDHMTVVYKPSPKGLLKLPIGERVALSVVSELHDTNCQVVQVVPPQSVKPSSHAPHITMSIAEEAQPKSAGELVADVHSGRKEKPQAWKEPLQLYGIVGVRLDNRSTVLSQEELFVKTGVHVHQVRRCLAHILRPNGNQVQQLSGSSKKTSETESLKKADALKQLPEKRSNKPEVAEARDSKVIPVVPIKKSAQTPDEQHIRELVESLTMQFDGLDKHVARQLLMVSDWDLPSAQSYLTGANPTKDAAGEDTEAGQVGQADDSDDPKIPLSSRQGPGILHVPYDMLEKPNVDCNTLAPSTQQTPSVQRGLQDDVSPTRRRIKQDELREQAELHRRKAREQSRISAEYTLLGKRAQSKGQYSAAQKYEAKAKTAKDLCQEYNKQAEETGYMASNLGKVCIHIMDFHLLHVSEALDRCEKVVKNLQDFVDTVGGCLYKLKIITGRGNNSQNQVPVLRPQIMEYLQKEGYSPFLEEANPGVVCVFIEPSAAEETPLLETD